MTEGLEDFATIKNINEAFKAHGFCDNHTCFNMSAINSTILHNVSAQTEMLCVFEDASENFRDSTFFHALLYFMYGLIVVVALVGNGMVCIVVLTTPQMKTVTNYFIVNLAVGDILMTLFCVPFSFVSMLVLKYWPFGALMCKIVNFSQAASVLISAYTLLAISIERYVAIMRPFQPRLSKTYARLVLLAVWSGALATAAPVAAVSSLSRPTPWHQTCELEICAEQWTHAEQSEQYTYALLALQFALPLSALVCTYARIACAVWSVRPPGEAQSVRDSRILRSKRKMVKMMVTVVAVFTICWLPLNIFILLWSLHEHDDSWALWPGMPYIWFICHWLAMSHCCYNPLIYGYMNLRYRRGFKAIVAAVLCIDVEHSSHFQRSSVCDALPMSEMIGMNNSTLHRRACRSCRAKPHTNDTSTTNTNSLKNKNHINTPSTNQCSFKQRNNSDIPARALSVNSHFK